MLGRRLVAFAVLCTLIFCAVAEVAVATDLQRNAYSAAFDGEDVYFLMTGDAGNGDDQDAWYIHSARRLQAGEPPVCKLPKGTHPYGMLYADGKALWYARYSQTLRTQLEDGKMLAALEFVRYDPATGNELVLVTDANPSALFPMDGHTLSYLPWGDEYALATVDFAAQTNLLTLRTEGSLIWDATMSNGQLYLVLYNANSGHETLHRITDADMEQFPEPLPTPDVSWLQGNFRVYVTKEGDFYAAPLSDPSQSHALSMGGEQNDVYYFGDYRWLCKVEPGNLARLYRVALAENEQIYYLEYGALSQPFVRGANAHEMITLDRRGRLLSVNADFSALTQVAQLEPGSLFSEATWLWALPFPDFVLMLGYSVETPGAPDGLDCPPDVARVVRRGEGMTDGPTVFPIDATPADP